MRRVAAIGVVVAALLPLAGCGGGSGTQSSSSTTSDPAPAVSASARQKLGKAALRKAQAQRRAAGRAAPFVRPASDNSVPTFGTEAAAAERAAAAASLGRYLQVRAGEDWSASCRLLARETRVGFAKLARTGAKGCAPVLAALSKEADLSDPLVSGLLSLRIHDRNAFALFYGPGRRQYFMPLVREGHAWRPTQPAPIEYPPGGTG